MRSVLEAEPLARVDYVAITDCDLLNPLEPVLAGLPTLVSMAVFIGTTRLIDNILIG